MSNEAIAGVALARLAAGLSGFASKVRIQEKINRFRALKL
jgi:hypothetical protein